jgi:2'-5' RNA ligase
MPDAARLFVAVLPPGPVLNMLAELARPAVPGVRWTSREQWHITLRFLGTVPVAPAVDVLARVRFAPVPVRLGPAVVRLGRSVLCVPAHGLDELAATIRLATAGVGEPPDPRPFKGHLTLGRLRPHATFGLAGQHCSVAFLADTVHLLRSELSPGGARYTVLASASAGTSAPDQLSVDSGSRRSDAEFMQ